jgi:hypothetical protein
MNLKIISLFDLFGTFLTSNSGKPKTFHLSIA